MQTPSTFLPVGLTGDGSRPYSRRRLVACTLAAIGVFAACAAPAPAASELRVRKDVKDLTAKERRQYVAAVKALKSTPSPYASGRAHHSRYTGRTGISWYDQFVLWHQTLSRCNPDAEAEASLAEMRAAGFRMTGHNGPLFLPWHRAFLQLFEDALRKVSRKNITIPYWDWSSDASEKAMLSDDFMGGDGDPNRGGALTRGPFRKQLWNNFPVRNEGLMWASSATPYITRKIGRDGDRPTAAQVTETMHAAFYDVDPFDDSSDHHRSFRNALEGWLSDPVDPATRLATGGSRRAVCGPDGWLTLPLHNSQTHNQGHLYIGGLVGRTDDGAEILGTMTAVPASPNDPIFFLHHSNVDRLWALWQKDHADQRFVSDPDNPYDAPTRPMEPFAADEELLTPVQVEDISRLGYRYAPPMQRTQRGGRGPARRSATVHRNLLCRLGSRY